jgi:hypothetical protein
MVSKVCSRSQGHPPGPRNRAMMDTARSNRSPVVGIGTIVNVGRDQPAAMAAPAVIEPGNV